MSPSGDLNPGTISISGQREYANGFMVNDADVVERFTMGAAIIPNLDSIAEFRVLTGNFDAEYGNYAGGRINVVTKSGTNQFHGDRRSSFCATPISMRAISFRPSERCINKTKWAACSADRS